MKSQSREKIERLVNYASENMGYDVILSKITDDLVDLIDEAKAEFTKKLINKTKLWDCHKNLKEVINELSI